MSRQRSAQPLPHVAVLYTRVSTKVQAGDDRHSLETQEAACRARALMGIPSLLRTACTPTSTAAKSCTSALR
jgi:hypothetical protein